MTLKLASKFSIRSHRSWRPKHCITASFSFSLVLSFLVTLYFPFFPKKSKQSLSSKGSHSGNIKYQEMLPPMQKIGQVESKTKSILDCGETSREKINTHLFLKGGLDGTVGFKRAWRGKQNDLWTVQKDFRVTQIPRTIKVAFMCSDPTFHPKTAKVRHNLWAQLYANVVVFFTFAFCWLSNSVTRTEIFCGVQVVKWEKGSLLCRWGFNSSEYCK